MTGRDPLLAQRHFWTGTWLAWIASASRYCVENSIGGYRTHEPWSLANNLPIIRVNQLANCLDVAASTGSFPLGVGGLLLDYLALELGKIIDPMLLCQYD
jgi:hypothetical protein